MRETLPFFYCRWSPIAGSTAVSYTHLLMLLTNVSNAYRRSSTIPFCVSTTSKTMCKPSCVSLVSSYHRPLLSTSAVSYTHLRQQGLHFTMQQVAEPLHISKKTIYTVYPSKAVSYTHLDVYKRQQLYRTEEAISIRLSE